MQSERDTPQACLRADEPQKGPHTDVRTDKNAEGVLIRLAKAPSFLDNESLKFIVFGGKGGAGKTTLSTSTALFLAEREPEKKILLVSVDPAHSLGDSFTCAIGNKVTPIRGRPTGSAPIVDNLFALEMNAQDVALRFKQKHGATLKTLLERGTFLDDSDIAQFLSLSSPGLNEIMAILEIIHLLKLKTYDRILLDTAPTGHTLSLFALPRHLEQWIRFGEMLQEKHKQIFTNLTGRSYKKDACDDFLFSMQKDLDSLQSLLRNQKTTEFVPITLPEPMSIEETQRLLSALRKNGIFVKTLVVNRVARGGDCSFCQGRQKDTEHYLREIGEKFSSYNLVQIPWLPYEVYGLARLKEFANLLSQEVPTLFSSLSPSIPEISRLPKVELPDDLGKDREFLFFGGKGGVGKTTLAATVAFHLACRSPHKKILLFSTDPAHSLSDVFGFCVGEEVTQVKGMKNLFAIEMNAGKRFDEFKKTFQQMIAEFFDRFHEGGLEAKADEETMNEFFSLSPPGIEEIMALLEILAFREKGEYDLYLLDCAATGHLLQFLELPSIFSDWLKILVKFLLKYKGMFKSDSAAKTVLEFSKKVRTLQAVLADPGKTEFLALTIPEAMSVQETKRLLSKLRTLHMACRTLLANMTVPSSNCAFCTSKRQEQLKWIRTIKTNYPEYKVVEIPLFPHAIKGMENLLALSLTLSKTAAIAWNVR